MSNNKLNTFLKSMALDAANVALFIGGFITLDSITYAVPAETALGLPIVLAAAALKAALKVTR